MLAVTQVAYFLVYFILLVRDLQALALEKYL
jgi:hypothetical protein